MHALAQDWHRPNGRADARTDGEVEFAGKQRERGEECVCMGKHWDKGINVRMRSSACWDLGVMPFSEGSIPRGEELG